MDCWENRLSPEIGSRIRKEGLDLMARVVAVSRLQVHSHSKRKSAPLECIVGHKAVTSELGDDVP